MTRVRKLHKRAEMTESMAVTTVVHCSNIMKKVDWGSCSEFRRTDDHRHRKAATLAHFAVQNGGIGSHRRAAATAAAGATFDQAEEEKEEEEDRSAFKHDPSAMAAHVCCNRTSTRSPVFAYHVVAKAAEKLAAAAAKEDKNIKTITRHYLGRGITKTGACSSSSQLRAVAAAEGEEEQEEQEGDKQASCHKGTTNPFLQLHQQPQQQVAGNAVKSLLTAATTITTGGSEAQESHGPLPPPNVFESAEIGQRMVESAELVSRKKEPDSSRSQLTDSAAKEMVPLLSSRSFRKLKRKFVPCVTTTTTTTTHEELDHPSLEPQGSLLHSLYLQLSEVGSAGIMLEEILRVLGSHGMQSRFGGDWQAGVKTCLETNPYFEEVHGCYILCELLVQPTACRRSSVSESVFVRHDCGGRKEAIETTLDTKSVPLSRQPDAACIQSDSASTLGRFPFDSSQLHEGIQTRRKAYQKTFEAVLNASAEEFRNLQNAKIERSDDAAAAAAAGTEKQQATSLAEPSALPGESKMSKAASTWEPKSSASRKATGDSIHVKEKQKRLELAEEEEEEEKLCERGGIKCAGSAIPGTLKAMQAKIEAEKGIQTGVRCARRDGSNSSSKWQCPMLARENHTLCEHHIYLNARKKARYAGHSQKQQADVVAGIPTPKKAVPEHKKSGRSATAKSSSSSMPTEDNGGTYTKEKLKAGKAKAFGNQESFDSGRLGAAMSLPPLPPSTGRFLQSAPLFEALVEVSLASHPLPETTATAAATVPETTFFSDKEKEKLPPWPMLQERNGSVQQHSPHKACPSKKYRAAMKKASKLINPRAADVEGMKAAVQHMFPAVRPPSIPPMPIQYGVRQKMVKNRSLLCFFPQG